MIATRTAELDRILGGGIHGGLLVDIFGPGGSGKSQLAMQVSASAAAAGTQVLYQDTAGAFRPERVIEMMPPGGELDRITVSRITNVSEQAGSIGGMSGFGLVIVDNVSDLFSFEYASPDRYQERGRRFLGYMRDLALFAHRSGTPVVMTNVVRTVGGRQVENFEAAVGLYSHARIRMEGSGRRRRCECATAFGTAGFGFEIGADGIQAAPAADQS